MKTLGKIKAKKQTRKILISTKLHKLRGYITSSKIYKKVPGSDRQKTIAFIGFIVFAVVIKLIFFPFIFPNADINKVSDNKYQNINPDFNAFFETNNSNLQVRFEAIGSKMNPVTSTSVADDNYYKSGLDMQLKLAATQFPQSQADDSKAKLKTAIDDYLKDQKLSDDDKARYQAGFYASLDEIFKNTEDASGSVELVKKSETTPKDTLIDKNVATGVDVSYQIKENEGVKETIILNEADSMSPSCLDQALSDKSTSLINYCKLPKNVFQYELTLDSGLKIEEQQENIDTERTNKIYYIVDSQGRYIAHLEPLFAKDANGDTTYKVGMQLDQVSDRVYKITAVVDMTWLLEKGRAYPINIDPSIVHNTQAQFDAGVKNRIATTSAPKVYTNYAELSTDINTMGLWHMNETANATCPGPKDVCDSSGNGNHGTVTNTSINTTTQMLGAAARTFAGNGNIAVADAAVLKPLTNNITIEAWFKTSVTTGLQMIVHKYNTASPFQGYAMAISAAVANDDKLGCWVGGSAWTESGTTVTDGNWHHGACVYDGTNVYVYVDGALQTYAAQSGTLSFAINLSIGSLNGGASSWFNGSIDEVRLSNITRTPEEIKNDAQRRPYGVFTSSTLDLGTNLALLDSVQWSETAVNVGTNGLQTPEYTQNISGIIASWGLNGTSGTTATNDGGPNSCGGTPANCNLTLANFANTTGQDVATNTGWTAINRKWGTGAINFDGTDDVVQGTPSSVYDIPANGEYTVDAWVNTYANGKTITLIQGATPLIYVTVGPTTVGGNNNVLVVYLRSNTSSVLVLSGVTRINDGKWHNVAMTMANNGGVNRIVNLYVDGKVDIPATTWAINDGFTFSTSSPQLVISAAGGGFTMNGTIDSVAYFNRALTADEIDGLYASNNIEFQTRTGATTDPNDGTWEAWKPSTSEVQIDNMDSINNNTNNLVGIYSSTPELAVANVNVGQNWIKYDNSIPAASNTTGTNGRIPVGTSGGDTVTTSCPSVIKDGSTYKMWYTGFDGISYRIFYATSSDGINWTKYDNSIPTASNTSGTNGRIPLGTSGADTQNVLCPSVIKDGSTYKMWYTGGTAPNTWILYATSPDGLTWTKQDNSVPTASNTTGTNGRIPLGTSGADTSETQTASVIKDGSTYKMWYGAYNGTNWRILYATSSDGLTWTKLDNSIATASNTTGTNGRIPLGTTGADTVYAYAANVIKDGNIYKMWYSASNNSNGNIQILYATSPDGLTWTKQDNSVPTASNISATNGRVPNGSSAADTTYAYEASVLKEGNKYRIWYSGNAPSAGSILYAEMAPSPENFSIDTALKTEGTGSLKAQLGAYIPTGQTVGLWHFEETGGTGAYIKDSSGKNSTLNVGTGADGSVTLASVNKNINTDIIATGRVTYADGIAYRVNAPSIGDTTITRFSGSDTISNGIAAGDELLLINLQGTSGDTSAVGRYEFVKVLSINASTITLTSLVTKSYTGTTASNQKVVVQRVPNYTNITLSGTSVITASSFDGLTTTPTGGAGYLTGIVAFRANGTVSVGTGTSISVTGEGYRGGTVGSAGAFGGNAGESYDGTNGRGGNGASGGESNGGGRAGDGGTASPANGTARGGGGGGGSDGSTDATSGTGGGGGGGGNGGGGGGGGGGSSGFVVGGAGGSGGATGTSAGGGGATGTPGLVGASGAGGNAGSAGANSSGIGGGAGSGAIGGSGGGGGATAASPGAGGGGGGFYGTSDLSTIFYGSGGGAGGGSTSSALAGKAGGNGGGIIFIGANVITVTSTGTITANGNNGTAGVALSSAGGSGAGGSIYLSSNSLTLGTALVTANGGSAQASGTQNAGSGAGGVGRIYLASTSAISGTTNPTFSSATLSLADLTPTASPTTVDGYLGKALSFNGTSQYLSCTDANCGGTSRLDTGAGPVSMGAWFKTISASNEWIMSKGTTATYGYQFGLNTGGTPLFQLINTASGAFMQALGATATNDGKWHYIVGTYDGTTIGVYVDGVLQNSSTTKTGTQLTDSTADFNIGRRADNAGFFNGVIDEPFFEHRALSLDEIIELYKGGRGLPITKGITSADLSSNTKMAFMFASDKQGQYSFMQIGNTPFANWEPDANTVGLWHFEEGIAGTGAYLKNSAPYPTNATPTGTTFVTGALGYARNFATASDFVTVPDHPSLELTTNFTMEAWVYPISLANATNQVFIKNTTNTNYYGLNIDNTGKVSCQLAPIGTTSQRAILTNTWSYIVCTFDGTNVRIYINGVLDSVTGRAGAITASTANLDIGRDSVNAGRNFVGKLDEIRISNTVRSDTDIRQAYDVGKRQYPIVVDFKAKLDPGNLITGSGDTSFTIDSTAFGAQNKGDNLFLGDKVIVKENNNGTEYTAQGTVDSITNSTGAVVVTSWDAGSTFPASGFTANATVIKWQTEWMDLSGSLTTNRNAITQLILRPIDGYKGANIWIDDVKKSGGYITNPTASQDITSSVQRYTQYRAIFSTTDTNFTGYISSVTYNYVTVPTPDDFMRHGKFFQNGSLWPYWWAR